MTHAVRAGSRRAVAAEVADVRPAGLWLVALLTILLGAWGGLVPFIGPLFGYRSHGQGSWQWSSLNGVLYVAPGAVALLFGIILLGRFRAIHRGATGFAGLVIAACGAWFVLGPSLWPTFGSGVVFTPSTTAMGTFIREVGYNLGVGVILAVLGGMAMKAVAKDRLVVAEKQFPVTEPYQATSPDRGVSEGSSRGRGTTETVEPTTQDERPVDGPGVEQTAGYADGSRT